MISENKIDSIECIDKTCSSKNSRGSYQQIRGALSQLTIGDWGEMIAACGEHLLHLMKGCVRALLGKLRYITPQIFHYASDTKTDVLNFLFYIKS